MEYIKTVMIMGCINMIAVCGMVLLTGYTGIFSMGHAGFMAVGGYTATILYMYVGVPYIMAVLLGGVAAGLVSVIVGYPTLKGKLTGDYFAIATLGFGEIVRLIVANVKPVLGGAMGIHDIPRLTTLWVVLVFTIIGIVFIRNYIKSHYGKNCIAAQQQEVAAEMVGIDIIKAKMTSLIISAFYAGLAGALFAFLARYISPVTFADFKSTDLTAAVVMGGMNSLSGPLMAAFILVLIPEFLRFMVEWRMVFYGLFFVIIMLFKPEGLLGYREISLKGLKKVLTKVVEGRKKWTEKHF